MSAQSEHITPVATSPAAPRPGDPPWPPLPVSAPSPWPDETYRGWSGL